MAERSRRATGSSLPPERITQFRVGPKGSDLRARRWRGAPVPALPVAPIFFATDAHIPPVVFDRESSGALSYHVLGVALQEVMDRLYADFDGAHGFVLIKVLETEILRRLEFCGCL